MRARTMAAGAATAALLVWGAAGQSKAGEMITSLDQPSVGVGLICNTPDQAQQYLKLRAGGTEAKAAIDQVNEAAKDAHACGVAAIAFVRDKMLDTQAVEDKLLEVVRINVLAGFDGTSWKAIPAMTQYAVMQGEGDSI